MKKEETVDPRELTEILNYYTHFSDSDNEVKTIDIIRVAKECLRLREILERINSVDLTRIEADNRSLVAVGEMKLLACKGLGNPKKLVIDSSL